MGGGHLSRPDFGMPQPDPAHPLTEFYLLLQHGLDRECVFALPALWADFQAPARRIYADEAETFLTLRETPGLSSRRFCDRALNGLSNSSGHMDTTGGGMGQRMGNSAAVTNDDVV